MKSGKSSRAMSVQDEPEGCDERIRKAELVRCVESAGEFEIKVEPSDSDVMKTAEEEVEKGTKECVADVVVAMKMDDCDVGLGRFLSR
jgi:formiminotetrahydrofolate cyclodeaminase